MHAGYHTRNSQTSDLFPARARSIADPCNAGQPEESSRQIDDVCNRATLLVQQSGVKKAGMAGYTLAWESWELTLKTIYRRTRDTRCPSSTGSVSPGHAPSPRGTLPASLLVTWSARLRHPRAGSGSFRTASSRVEIKFRDSWLRALGEVACDSFVPFARQSACGIGSMVESFARSRRFFQLLVGFLCRLRLE